MLVLVWRVLRRRGMTTLMERCTLGTPIYERPNQHVPPILKAIYFPLQIGAMCSSERLFRLVTGRPQIEVFNVCTHGACFDRGSNLLDAILG